MTPGKSGGRLKSAQRSADTHLSMERFTFFAEQRSRTKIGGSRDSIRARKRLKSRISPWSRLRVDRLHLTANISGRIIGLRTKPSRSIFQISSSYGRKIPAKLSRYRQSRNSSSKVTTSAGGKPS